MYLGGGGRTENVEEKEEREKKSSGRRKKKSSDINYSHLFPKFRGDLGEIWGDEDEDEDEDEDLGDGDGDGDGDEDLGFLVRENLLGLGVYGESRSVSKGGGSMGRRYGVSMSRP